MFLCVCLLLFSKEDVDQMCQISVDACCYASLSDHVHAFWGGAVLKILLSRLSESFEGTQSWTE